MGDHQTQQSVIPTNEKPHKSKKRVVGTIYAYIVGAGLVILLLDKVVIGAMLGIETEDSRISSAILGVLFLVVVWFLLRGGIEKIFEKSSILPKDFLRISIFVALIPFIGFLFTLFLILIDEIGALQALTISGVYAGITIASGVFYGTATYFWLRRFSPTTILSEDSQKTRSTFVGALIIVGVLILAHVLIISIVAGGILLRQQLSAPEDGVAVPQTVDETANWKTFRNEEFGFEVKYPQDAERSKNRVYLSFTQGTTLSEKYLEISTKESLPAHCFGQVGNLTSKTETVSVNDVEFRKETGGNVGAGQIYNITSYFTQKEGRCIGLNFVLHSVNAGALDFTPPTFDREKESEVFDQILSTFRFIDQDKTANWQTYRNDEFGFEVKYPNSWSTDASSYYSIVYNTVVNRINFGEIGKEYYSEESEVNAISIFIQEWDGNNTPLDLASKRSEHIGIVTQFFVAGEKAAQSSNYVGSVTYLIHNGNLYIIATPIGGSGEILGVYNSMLDTFKFTD